MKVEDLKKKIKNKIRTTLSPRHVPDEIHAAAEVPTKLNGKKLEVPVKKIVRFATREGCKCGFYEQPRGDCVRCGFCQRTTAGQVAGQGNQQKHYWKFQ